MGNRRNKVIAVIGFLIVVVTLLLFFLIIESKKIIDWAGLVFILIAEFGFFSGLISIDIESKYLSSSVMLRSGAYSILSIYAVIAISLSILFLSIPFLRERIKLLVTLQIAVIAISAVMLLILLVSSRSIAEKIKTGKNSDT